MVKKTKEMLRLLIAKYKRLNTLYVFILHAVLLFVAFRIFYVILRDISVVDRLYEYFTYHLSNTLLYGSKLLLTILGYHSEIFPNRHVIRLEGTSGIFLNRGCLARNLMVLFSGFIIVFPGKIKSKLWYIPLGLLLISIINIIRISGLSLTLFYYPEGYDKYDHHALFNYLVYILIFFMWFFWIRRFSKYRKKKKHENKKQTNGTNEIPETITR